MGVIWKWFCSIALLIPVLVILIGNLFHCWYRIKCFKIEQCSNKQCKYGAYCPKYREVLTKEDMDKIQKLIDQF